MRAEMLPVDVELPGVAIDRNAMLNPSYDVNVLLVNVNVNLRAAGALLSQIGRKQWRGTLIDFR